MLRNIFRISVCVMLMSFFNVCTASETLLGDEADYSNRSSTNITPHESHARFAQPSDGDDDDEAAESTPQNATFATQVLPSAAATTGGADQAKEDDTEEYVNVPTQAKISPEFSIVGGMFDALVVPDSTMPYTVITLSGCICQALLAPSTFQNNSALVRINLSGSQLNFRDFEEKFGEGCLSLTHINLLGTIDGSVEGYPIITPERFAQLAHPDILQRILHGQCSLSISHPTREGGCYTVSEMKEKFLSSILQLRSLNKAKETLSTYQSLINMLRSGIEGIDPRAVAAAGANVAFKVCTGL